MDAHLGRCKIRYPSSRLFTNFRRNEQRIQKLSRTCPSATQSDDEHCKAHLVVMRRHNENGRPIFWYIKCTSGSAKRIHQQPVRQSQSPGCLPNLAEKDIDHDPPEQKRQVVCERLRQSCRSCRIARRLTNECVCHFGRTGFSRPAKSDPLSGLGRCDTSQKSPTHPSHPQRFVICNPCQLIVNGGPPRDRN